MKLTKYQIRAIVGYATLLLVFSVLAFLLPFKHTAIFWIGYGFGMVALIAQVAIFALAFYDARTAASRFYGIPVARVGFIYLLSQIAVSFLAMALSGVEAIHAWPFILLSVLLFAAAVLGTIATDSTRDEIERQDAELKQNVQMMRELQSLGAQIAGQSKDLANKDELRRLCDQLRYSDPVSNSATAEAENELFTLMNEIQRAVLDGDNNSVSELCRNATSILTERNRICKLNKH